MRADGSDPKKLFAPERDTYPSAGHLMAIPVYQPLSQGGRQLTFIASTWQTDTSLA